MKRSDLYNATKTTSALIKEFKLVNFLSNCLEFSRGRSVEGKTSKDTTANLFEISSKLAVEYEKMSSVQKKLIEIVEIDPIFTFEFWSSVLEDAGEGPDGIHFNEFVSTYRNLAFFEDRVPSILGLLERRPIESLEKKAGLAKGSGGLLKIILADETDLSTSPTRVSNAMGGIDELYNVHAKILGLSEYKIKVVACDSGSDKSFDFLGAAKVVEQVRGTLLDIWDRRRFQKNNELSAMIGNVAESLPVISRISEMEDAGELESEEASLLKSGLIRGVNQVIESGLIIPEMESLPKDEPRKLMGPQTKFLTGPDEVAPKKKSAKRKPRARTTTKKKIARKKK